jgi:GT2 family glycosyltransferase
MPSRDPSPDVSILVLFMAGSPWIGKCLDSVARHAGDRFSREVIVLANGVAAGAELPVQDGDGVRVLRTEVNLGFGGGCNWAAAHAQGRYLVLLNDDTEVEAGWLEELVSVAEARPEVGAVGSMVTDFDGRVEEAGRLLWRDGVGSGFAHGLRAQQATVPKVRPVDYSSGCSLLVRREAWLQAGGFDERYYPAYYEDADLCLELRRRGWLVVCASHSHVRHRRSTSTPLLWRRFLGLRNHAAFVAKWSETLAELDPRPRDQPTTAEVETAWRRRAESHPHASQESMSRRSPEPRDDGGSTRRSERASTLDDVARLRVELEHLKAQLELKDEYIDYLATVTPDLERGLRRVLADERRQTRRRELLRRVPVLGPVAAWGAREGRRLRNRR